MRLLIFVVIAVLLTSPVLALDINGTSICGVDYDCGACDDLCPEDFSTGTCTQGDHDCNPVFPCPGGQGWPVIHGVKVFGPINNLYGFARIVLYEGTPSKMIFLVWDPNDVIE